MRCPRQGMSQWITGCVEPGEAPELFKGLRAFVTDERIDSIDCALIEMLAKDKTETIAYIVDSD